MSAAGQIPDDYRLIYDACVQARAYLGEGFTCAFCGRAVIVGPKYFGCNECGILDASMVLNEAREFVVPDDDLSGEALELRACIVAEAEGMIDP